MFQFKDYKMKKYLLVLPLLVVLFFACTSPNDGKSEMLSVKADLDKAGVLRASEYFDEVTYVPLETSDEFLIDYAGKSVVSGNSLYVMCDKSVHVFSTETGEGKMSLSKLGNGPGEYKSLTDFIVGDTAIYVSSPERERISLFAYRVSVLRAAISRFPFHP